MWPIVKHSSCISSGLHLTANVLPVADVLQVAHRLLPAQVRLLLVGFQPGVRVSAELGAAGHAAGGRAPHVWPLCGKTLSAGAGAGAWELPTGLKSEPAGQQPR